MLLNTRASTDTVIWLLDWAVVCLAWLPVFRLVLLEMLVCALAVSRRRSSSVWFSCWFSERLWPCTVWSWPLSLWPWPTSTVKHPILLRCLLVEKRERKEKCTKRDSNPRVRTHYGLNVTPWTTRASVLVILFSMEPIKEWQEFYWNPYPLS